MTGEQKLKFNKYVAKQLKKVLREREIDSSTYKRKFKVKVYNIIPPKSTYGNFRVNVKVISSVGRRPMRDEYGSFLRDDDRNIIYEWTEFQMRRSEVRTLNTYIRDDVNDYTRDLLSMFGVEPWRIKVERIIHS